jgi:hypothetical protein
VAPDDVVAVDDEEEPPDEDDAPEEEPVVDDELPEEDSPPNDVDGVAPPSPAPLAQENMRPKTEAASRRRIMGPSSGQALQQADQSRRALK